MKILGTSALLSLLFGCFNIAPNNGKKEEILKIIVISDEAYWNTVNPIQFLDTLESYGANYNFVISAFPKKSWFNVKLKSEIEKELTKTEGAAFVSSFYESNMHSDNMKSTVGVQARYMLKGFDVKKYPPTLCSYHYFF